jgi:hypothetical protein
VLTQDCTLQPNRVRFYSLTVLHDSEPGRRAFAGSHLAVAATCAVLLAATGCGASTKTTTPGSTSAASGTTSPGTWTGLGATLTAWESAHPKNPAGCEATPCYGGQMPDGGKLTDQFSELTTTEAPEYRVDGYTEAIGDGTSLATAKADVLKLLPADTTVTAFWISHEGGSCAFWNLKSATLGRWFAKTQKVGDAQGALGIAFFAYTSGDEWTFDPNNVSNAEIGIAPERRGTSC